MAVDGGEVGRVQVWRREKKEGLVSEGFGWFSQKTGRMERRRGRQGERGRGLAPDLGTL